MKLIGNNGLVFDYMKNYDTFFRLTYAEHDGVGITKFYAERLIEDDPKTQKVSIFTFYDFPVYLEKNTNIFPYIKKVHSCSFSVIYTFLV